MNKESKIRVGISVGDLNGIGAEVILKTFTDNRMFDFCTPIVFANSRLMNFFKKTLQTKTLIQPIKNLDKVVEGKLNVIDVWEESLKIEFGKEDTTIGSFAIKSLEAATQALKEDQIDVLVTAPIHKTAIQSDTFKFPGHTDYLGDNGVIGKEDDEILRPTLEKIKTAGKLVFGPYAADSFFGSNNYKQFDAIVATYHDQGLIPFKTLSFGQGVNYTAGLNKVRTSPDHGTAFEIAGKGTADASSFTEAVFRAISIFKNRKIYAEISENPLKKQNKKRPQEA